jgi:hypothetical protein
MITSLRPSLCSFPSARRASSFAMSAVILPYACVLDASNAPFSEQHFCTLTARAEVQMAGRMGDSRKPSFQRSARA